MGPLKKEVMVLAKPLMAVVEEGDIMVKVVRTRKVVVADLRIKSQVIMAEFKVDQKHFVLLVEMKKQVTTAMALHESNSSHTHVYVIS